MKHIFFIVALSLAACSSKSSTPPAEPEPAPAPAPGTAAASGADCGIDPATGTPATAEQCECKGLTVVGDIGNGQVACPAGTTEVSRIAYGIEGGVCCTPAAAAP